MSDSDPYKVLQVDPEAERDIIETAYRRLARRYHPDVSADPESHVKMIALNRAWEQLRDPVKRAAVDRARQRSSGTAAWVAASAAQSRTAGTASSTNRHGATHGTNEPIGRASARPPSVPPQVGGAQAPASDPSTWPLGMSDPGQGHPEAGAESSAQAGPRSWSSGRAHLGSAGASGTRGLVSAPPGSPAGSVLNFGRFAGWSLGEIARTEIDYLEWLDRMPIGRTYQQEIDELLRAHGRRSSSTDADQGRGGAFRRR